MSILIIGGTSEGRHCIKVCEEAGQPFYYSTYGTSQEIPLHNGIRITGPKDAQEFKALCIEKGIKLIIDAAHPFATNVHANVGQIDLPTIRYERKYPQIPSGVICIDTWDEAIQKLKEIHPLRTLALTGVNSIGKLKQHWQILDTYFRIMPIQNSLQIINEVSFPEEKLIFYKQEQSDETLFKRLSPDLILIKESGESSGFLNKVTTAMRLGIKVLMIKRPPLGYLPQETVTGVVGLRRSIEQLLPSYFPQRIGFTTGTTATAATQAAMIALVNGEEPKEVFVQLPDGEFMPFPIHRVSSNGLTATAVAVKYAGDDPDITDGAEIHSIVTIVKDAQGVHFLQGEGVGTVTLPGLGLEVGGPAVNNTPRKMMTDVVNQYVNTSLLGVEITISVPKGKTLAKETFNPRLGIIDGISIIGTTGIVRPYSNDTWIASIKREMDVSKAVGVTQLVLNSGGRSEKYLKQRFPHLPSNAFIQYGNFIGQALSYAHTLQFPQISLGIMLGKAVKLAAGELDTHSHKVTMDKSFLNKIAQASGTNISFDTITLAREIWDLIPDRQADFYQHIINHCLNVCQPLVPDARLEILLMDNEGQFITKQV